ncbi:biotin--[acetyl-CoA-carboxylase] ligase [Arsenicicoccus dermatophilus]|uniref:biotin--[acetyl-CoA-carboxylase] ligase n=1 Tax=Arsenicicoccus dermatophilus TaxID=1076331 RepID=UPI00391745D5
MTSALRADALTARVTDAMSAGPEGGSSPWQGVTVLDRVDSTNAELVRHPRPWQVVTADHQQAGRGRLTRSWQTPAGMAVTLSACVPAPVGRAADLGWLPLLTGLAVRDALVSLGLSGAVLKWPNDVLVTTDDERKVCGVLCELVPAAGLAVLGLGINVHQGRADLPVERATSLALCGLDVGREDVVVAVLTALGRRHAQWALPARLPALVREYADACATIDRDVAISLPDGSLRQGRALRVDAAGRLVVRTDAGETAHAAGDVVHARLAD